MGKVVTPTSGNTTMDDIKKTVQAGVIEAAAKPEWVKPELTAYAPVQAAEGISYRPNDGLSNLS